MDKIIEIKPDLVTGAGEIIWEWKAVDHLVQDFDATKNNYGVVADNPQLFNFNYFKRNRKHKTINDWMHVNSVSYNEKLDQIMFGHHAAHQMVIIDHSTTTKEAASHSGGKYGKGGDILYRWGNPSSYDAKGKTVFQAIHDAHWIPEGLPDAGKVMMFDNGYQSKASKIRVISIPQSSPGVYDLESASTFTKQDWVYDNGKDFFSKDMGSAHQLPNGNFFINESITGRSFEVDKNNTILWEYKNPIVNSSAVEWDDVIVTEDNELKNAVFMSFRYAPDYSGFEGQEMTSGEPIETYLSVTKVTIPKGKKYKWQGEKYKKTGIYIVSGHYLDLVVE